jgi:hypothetical protein
MLTVFAIEKARPRSGRGQTVVQTMEELEHFVKTYPADDLTQFGLVLEMNLTQVATMNFGIVTIDDVTMSYLGTQRMIS